MRRIIHHLKSDNFLKYRYNLKVLLSCFLISALICLKTHSQERPNIILIMADDLGWGDVGFNGNKDILTPHLDSMASQGIVFDRFYAASPVCSPTRASCLTGRNPYRQGIYTANTGHLKQEEITLAELLKDQGYSTGIFGKWHLGTLTTKENDANRGRPGKDEHYTTPDSHGFDRYFVTESKVPTFDPLIKPKTFLTDTGESLRYGWSVISNTNASVPYGTSYWVGKEKKANPEELKGDDTKIIMNQSLRFIKDAVDHKRPFLSVIWLHTPHLPVVASEIQGAKYPNATHAEKLYWGTITAMDEQMGRLQQFLKEKGIADNTMIWFASDNGPELRTPGKAGSFKGKKRDLYEGGVRVPAFCVWPAKISAGQRSILPTVTSDYLPTIMTMVTGSYTSKLQIDGISIYEHISTGNSVRSTGIGFQHPNRMSWVTDNYKIVQQKKGAPFEMYNLKNDPYEKTNIINDEPDLFYRLSNALFSWVESCKKSEMGLDY